MVFRMLYICKATLNFNQTTFNFNQTTLIFIHTTLNFIHTTLNFIHTTIDSIIILTICKYCKTDIKCYPGTSLLLSKGPKFSTKMKKS